MHKQQEIAEKLFMIKKTDSRNYEPCFIYVVLCEHFIEHGKMSLQFPYQMMQ